MLLTMQYIAIIENIIEKSISTESFDKKGILTTKSVFNRYTITVSQVLLFLWKDRNEWYQSN